MGPFLNLLTIALALWTAVNGETFDVPSSAQQYLRFSQHELLNQIEIVDLKIDASDKRFDNRLDIIRYQQELTLNEIQQLNQTSALLQTFVNLPGLYCIKKYSSNLISYNHSRHEFQTCISRAICGKGSLVPNPKLHVDYARSIVTDVLPMNIANICNTIVNHTPLEDCYYHYVSTAKMEVEIRLKYAQDELEKGEHVVSELTRTAVSCSFKLEKKILDNIIATRALIGDCQRNE